MKVIGLTGGSGVGKTTALHCLEERGALMLDADAIYHDLLAGSGPMVTDLRQRFPSAFPDGSLDRKALGAVVFADEEALADLNRITHGHVCTEIRRQLTAAALEGRPCAAIDAVALLESGAAELCDVTVAVTAPTETRISRLVLRDGITPEYAALRIAAQKDNETFAGMCDYVLVNDCPSEAAFAARCEELFCRLLPELPAEKKQ